MRPVRFPALLLALLAITSGCAAIPPRSTGSLLAASAPTAAVSARRVFTFATDTFAFPNEIRARHQGADDLYANYCFVLARGLRQFFAFARFDAGAPRLDHAGYVARIREVVARPPWSAALAPPDRVVIPGYANLRDLSRGEEAAVKEGLGSPFWTWLHWTNWRVTRPVSRSHQEAVAARIIEDLDGGRLPQLLVTNWPKPELNHTIVVYEYTEAPRGVEFRVWDPNDPQEPGRLIFDRDAGRFWAAQIYDTQPGPIRAFRMYYSPWL
jgi:hypothetical protein